MKGNNQPIFCNNAKESRPTLVKRLGVPNIFITTKHFTIKNGLNKLQTQAFSV